MQASPAAPRQPMTACDSAWRRMEVPNNLMTITAVLTFEEPLPLEILRRRVEETFLPFERFRQKVVDPGGIKRPYWELDEGFSLDHHLVSTTLPRPEDKAALQEMVSEQMSTPLDPGRPLWQFHHIADYRGGSALVARVHHCIGDGMSLVPVLLKVADPVEGDIFAPNVPPSSLGEGAHPLARLGRALKFGGQATVTMGRLATMARDPSSAFKGALKIPKRAAWSPALPLANVKRIGKALGGTVNDVLLSAVAGSLRRYLIDRGERVPESMCIRAVVPFNLRKPDDSLLGNKFGLVFLPLPLGLSDPVERLREVHRRMQTVKTSPEPVVAFGLLQVLGATSARLQEQVLRYFGQKATAVMTNLPGPRNFLRVGGIKVDGLMFWVPQSGQLGLGVSILSYADQVRLGIATDVGLVPDPEALTSGFQVALDELLDASENPKDG